MPILSFLLLCCLPALLGIGFLVFIDWACRPGRHHDHLIPATPRSARR